MFAKMRLRLSGSHSHARSLALSRSLARAPEATGDVTWDHPLDGPTRAKIDAARQNHAAKTVSQGAKPAGGISASVPDFGVAMKSEVSPSLLSLLPSFLPFVSRGLSGQAVG